MTTTMVAGRYRLGEVLGRGGMADVHRATDTVLAREVAVKLLRSTADQASDRARFTAEARTLAGLSHRGLVTVLDAGVDAEHPFLVMELVEGTTLGARLADGPLPAAEAARIGQQVADALSYAHGRGVVHRDVKPGNVLLAPDGRVKLADFGIARLIGDTVRHTQTGTAVGTAAYLAPEQVRGEELDTSVDVWSLGLVLLEALTGERAYPGSPTESAMARLHRPPPVPADLPPGWSDLLCAMTAADPAARPSTAQVAARLGALRQGPPAGPPGPPPYVEPAPTAVLTAPVASPGPPPPPLHPPTGAAGRPRRGPGARLAALEPHQKGLAGALGGIVLLLVVAAFASTGSAGDPAEVEPVPDDVPARLQSPLQDLHDAVGEAGR
ncbi:serine/threonine-protein kinase [Nocardioides kribbensis]|uniref:serine/threonine-protein kinase n=1 Tax=Nocardioides kribbensis TaxID=305517 RepID=UPI00187A9810|nr:serine/threonine-protein kinase [Nocardioides kribbensis]